MNKEQLAKSLSDLGIFYKAIGFDDQTITDHQERLWKLVFTAVVDNLEKLTVLKDKEPFPEVKSIKDFFDYYDKYLDKDLIEKIIKEETQKIFSGYFKMINEQLIK